ncbi:MAG: hypothetical protein LBO66_03960, partial [Deltaproteobacteria bacterium]|nr:hypothetical protein [Deltaproteobacteria bacterium]
TALGLARDCAEILVEDPRVKSARRLWGRKISDLGFASFARILDWERLWNGARLVKIPLSSPVPRPAPPAATSRASLL